jgi:spermidine synthase
MIAGGEVAETRELTSGKRALLYGIFIVSGCCGLIYETTWMRMFGLVFGSTVYSVTMVLAAFMAGLALGSWLLGRFADRCAKPLRLYARLEAGIGIIAAASPWIIRGIEPLYVWLYRSLNLPFGGVTAIKFALSFLIVLVPTFLMGGTFPVMNRFLIRRLQALGALTGALYGVNTMGAVLGTLFAAFFLIGAVGVSRAIYVAAVMNLAIALAVTAWGARSGWEAAPATPREPHEEHRSRDSFSPLEWLAALAFLFSGLAALGYEIVWARALIYTMGTSVYAVAVMLASFLLGIAVGPMLIGRLADRMKRPLFALALIEAIIGLTSVAGLVALTAWLWHPAEAHRLPHDFVIRFIRASLLMLPSTLLMGAAFPVVARMVVKRRGTLAGRIGRIYALNTLGSIAGALLAGLVLLGALGVWRTMLALATVNLLVAVALLWRSELMPALRRSGALAVLAVLVVGWPMLQHADPFKTRVIATENLWGPNLFYGEDEYATVTVFKGEGRPILLAVDGVPMTTLSVDTQLMAHLPLALLSEPRDALVICLGMGTTFNSTLAHPEMERVDAVELVPDVVKAYPVFADNPRTLSDPRAHIHITDGRNFLLLTQRKYDFINVDPPPPTYSPGAVLLSSLDFFKLCKAHLKPNGIMMNWIPTVCTLDEHRRLARTFQQVFPHATMWLGPDGHGVYLLGTQRPLGDVLNLKRLIAAFARPEVVADMAKYLSPARRIRPADIPGLFLMDEDTLRRYGRDLPATTDDRPYVEFPLQWRASDQLIDLNRDLWPRRKKLDRILAAPAGGNRTRVTNLP